MVACVTYYLAKSLNFNQETRMASSVLELGKKLLQEISEPSQQPPKNRVQQDTQMEALAYDEKPSEHLKALDAIFMKSMHDDVTFCNKTASQEHILTGQEDPVVLYMVIKNKPLQNAFQEVMKFKQASWFLEFLICLLQKALQEDQLDLVMQWEPHILDWLCRFDRRDEALLATKKPPSQAEEESKGFTTSVIEYNTKKQVKTSCSVKKSQRKKLLSAFKRNNSKREIKALDVLVNQLTALIRRHRHGWKLRKIHSEDSLWRCHINLSLACAHLGLLRRNLGPPPQLCFSHLPLSFFSLAHCGMLVMWKNVPQRIRAPELPDPRAVSHPGWHISQRHVKDMDTNHGESNSNEEDSETDDEVDSKVQYTHISEKNGKFSVDGPPADQTTSQLLDTLNKASINLRRAMVLAHRWGHWTTLQWACRTLWDQSSTLILMLDPDALSGQLTLDQMYTVITPLLVLASDLLMDMMEKLKLWDVYETEEEELETSLYFSSQMDDGTVVDLRWLRTLVLHTLELLYYQAKWENLAHLALLFNSYTRERYSHMVTPILVHAQRRLLDRIRCFGGPPAPQPHFTYTEMITGEKVTCRTYAGKQLLFPCGKGPLTKNDSHSELADVKRAMCLVCVPLDVEDTLRCFRETMERRRFALLTFQHSRNLLHLLLADTQHSYVKVPFSKKPSGVLQGKLEFSLAATTPPGISPLDLSAEDYSTLGSIYSTTLPPSQIQTVLSSYNNAIKYLQANKYNSLQVQALHDLGNLHFYKGNRKSAHSFWSKALDCALQSSGVLESWDGDSWSSSTSQETLRNAGIWGCLQGALLSAKIAQHILTPNINQRTKCCLLSTKLFKCLLMASMPHPMMDLAYATYSVETELIPGIDLFSEPDRGNLGTTVASLSFLCHWLYNSGHFLKALPVLALYLYIAKTVCRDPHLTVSCRILKVKVLTELRIFSQAVEELSSLTFGKEITLPYGGNHRTEESSWATNRFIDGKPLLDPLNLQVLEDVINRSPSEDIRAFYGSKLTRRVLMARVHLILTICSTIHNLPEPLTTEVSICLSDTFSGDYSNCSKGLQLNARKGTLTLGELKAILLKVAHVLVNPEIFALHPLNTDPEELELAVEIRLLLSNINLQHGRMAASADLAVSAISLLQSSPVFQSDFRPIPPPTPPSSTLRRSRSKAHQISSQEPKSILSLQTGDVPSWVDSRERMDRLFWLRCRLAVVCSLVGHIPGTSIYSGVDSSTVAFRVLKEGLAEAEAWGDPDTKALLLLQGVQLNTHLGKAREDSTLMLQEIVSLLSGRITLSQRSQMALAEAALLLSELRGTGSQTLHLITQKLLQKQLCALGETVDLNNGGDVELESEGLKNIYLLQLPMLAKTTMRMGHSLALQALLGSSEAAEEPWRPLVSAQEVLQSALNISQASANRDLQLEGDILFCTGLLGRHLISMQKSDPQKVLEALLQCVHSHSHNLLLIQRCYLEMALVYLQQWEHAATPPAHLTSPTSPTPDEVSKETDGETYLLVFWICLRMALKTSETIDSCYQFHGFTEDTESHLSPSSIKALPDFTSNDLLHTWGRQENHGNLSNIEEFMDTGHELNSGKCSQLTWVHLSRYYTHLLNLLQMSSQPVKGADGLLSVAGDGNLSLRLSQIHTFFSCHLPSYKEQLAVPEPPAAVILEPQLMQASLSQEGEPVPNLYPWAIADTQELCIQWYRPTLQDSMILLVFAVNNAPVSAMSPSAEAVAGLQAGQKLVCLDRLKAVHALLRSVCTEADVSSITGSTSSINSQATSTHPRQQEILWEKTILVCTEIRDLLKPNLNLTPITEVPFDPTMPTLCDLERCFNPLTGSTLRDKGFITWLLSLMS